MPADVQKAFREAGSLASSPRGAVIVAVLATLVQLPIFDLSLVSLDEGQLVTIASRLLHGELLYRDIYTGIFPGIYWMTAGLLAALGRDVVVTRYAAVGVNSAIAVSLWLLARRLAGARAWVAPALFIALVIASFPVFVFLGYASVSLLFALVAMVCLQRYLRSGRSLDGLLCGVFVVACGVTKQNFGALLAVSAILGMLWNKRDSALLGRAWAPALAPPVAGGVLAGVAVLGAIAYQGTLVDFFSSTILGVPQSQLSAFHQPIPPIFADHPRGDGRFTFLYSPPLLFGYLVRGEAGPLMSGAIGPIIRVAYGGAIFFVGAALFLLRLLLKSSEAETRRAARTLLPFAALFFLGLFPSAVWSHLAIVLIPLLLVAAVLADLAARALDRFGKSGHLLTAAISFAACGALLAGLFRAEQDLRRWYPEALEIPGASLHVSPGQALLYRGATAWLRACAPEGGTAFVAPDMPLLYFLSDRKNPTPYDLLIPGSIHDSLIVDRLLQSRTSCAVYNPRMYVQFAPFAELFPATNDLLKHHFVVETLLQGEGSDWYCMRHTGSYLGSPQQ